MSAKPSQRRRRAPRSRAGSDRRGESLEQLHVPGADAERGAILAGGDVDADWQRAESSGEEAVGGSVATPDQDVVDEIGEALGVPQAADAEVRTSAEILRDRDQHRWDMERKSDRDSRGS